MFSKFVTWIKREGSSLEVAFHNAVNSIHAELDRLEGIATTAEGKAGDLADQAKTLAIASAEHTALAVTARKVVADVSARL